MRRREENFILLFNKEEDKILLQYAESAPFKGRHGLITSSRYVTYPDWAKYNKNEVGLVAAYRMLEEETGIKPNMVHLRFLNQIKFGRDEHQPKMSIYFGHYDDGGQAQLIGHSNMTWFPAETDFSQHRRFVGYGLINYIKNLAVNEVVLEKYEECQICDSAYKCAACNDRERDMATLRVNDTGLRYRGIVKERMKTVEGRKMLYPSVDETISNEAIGDDGYDEDNGVFYGYAFQPITMGIDESYREYLKLIDSVKELKDEPDCLEVDPEYEE
jgi:hypothetical protein